MRWDEVAAGLGLAVGPAALLLLGCGRRLLGPGLVLWMAVVGSFLVSCYRQLSHPYPPPEYLSHVVNHGGQVGMWGNYHVEVARFPGDEYRVWVSDAYRRPISSRFYQGAFSGDPSGLKVDLTSSLDGSYAFARLPGKPGAVRLALAVPQGQMQFRFSFTSRRRTYSAEWCGPDEIRPPLRSASSPYPRE